MCAKKNDDNYFHLEQKLDDDLQAELDAALGDMSIEDILASISSLPAATPSTS